MRFPRATRDVRQWHKTFAFLPKRSGEYVLWLEVVWCRAVKFDHEGCPEWEYFPV